MSLFGKISAKEQYALRLILQLAKHYEENAPLPLSLISKTEKISLKYLEQLIAPFKEAKWVKSERGKHGGYILIKDPKDLSLKDFFTILKGNIWIIQCLNPDQKFPCSLDKGCASKIAWSRIQGALNQCIENIKLQELINI